jgi:hypothetical protein
MACKRKLQETADPHLRARGFAIDVNDEATSKRLSNFFVSLSKKEEQSSPPKPAPVSRAHERPSFVSFDLTARHENHFSTPCPSFSFGFSDDVLESLYGTGGDASFLEILFPVCQSPVTSEEQENITPQDDIFDKAPHVVSQYVFEAEQPLGASQDGVDFYFEEDKARHSVYALSDNEEDEIEAPSDNDEDEIEAPSDNDEDNTANNEEGAAYTPVATVPAGLESIDEKPRDGAWISELFKVVESQPVWSPPKKPAFLSTPNAALLASSYRRIHPFVFRQDE